MDILLISATLLLITTGQILQKVAADKAAQHSANIGMIGGLIRQHETWWAVLCLATGMAFWMAVLYRMEVSQAYPYLGLGYVLVLLASRSWLNEQISGGRWFGVFLIICGITILSI